MNYVKEVKKKKETRKFGASQNVVATSLCQTDPIDVLKKKKPTKIEPTIKKKHKKENEKKKESGFAFSN